MVIIPLIVNVVGFIVSLLVRPISDRIGKKVRVYMIYVVSHCIILYVLYP